MRAMGRGQAHGASDSSPLQALVAHSSADGVGTAGIAVDALMHNC